MQRMFADAFRHFRHKAGLTQALVAKKAGIAQSEVSRLEDGFHWPSFKTVRKICRAIGVKEKIFCRYLAHNLLNLPSEVWLSMEEDDDEYE